MNVTVVLRLLAGPLRSGELVGHAEVVASGRVVAIRDAADLVRVAQEASDPTKAPEARIALHNAASSPSERIRR